MTKANESPTETLQAEMARQGITITAEFVPWSKSRNAESDNRSLNWIVVIHKNRKPFLRIDYTAGIGHCPAYKAPNLTHGRRDSLVRADRIKFETETGFESRDNGLKGPKLEPDAADVIYSLCLDASAIDHPTFESWANELGMDTDSRKAETMYRSGLDAALKLRAALGDDGMSALRNACQDY